MNWTEYQLDLGNNEYNWYASNGDLSSVHQSENPPIVFLNGLSCTELHYEKLIPALHKKNYPLIINDYRGHFRSSKMPINRISIESISSDIVSLIKKHKLKNVVLIGHSMGANIAVQVALKTPQSIGHMVLIGGPASEVSDSMFHSNAIDFILPLTKKLESLTPIAQNFLWKRIESSAISKIVYNLGFNTDHVKEGYVKRYLKELTQVNPEVFNKLIKELISQNYLPKLAMIKCPTLIIGGSDDHIVTPKQYELFESAMTNAKFIRIDKGSHVPQVEFPKIVNKQIIDFMTI